MEKKVDRFEFLDKLLSRQIEMLRFAEAKNGALLATSMGGVALLSQTFIKSQADNSEIPIWLFMYSVTGICFLALTICLCLHSFIPKYKTDNLEDDNSAGRRNLTYYDDIKRFSETTYKNALTSANNWPNGFSNIEEEFISQSIIISRITSRKMEIFKIGIYSFLFGAFTPFAGIVFILYNRYSDHLFRKIGLY